MGAVIVEYSLRSCFTNPIERAKERAREREKAKNSSNEKNQSDFGPTDYHNNSAKRSKPALEVGIAGQTRGKPSRKGPNRPRNPKNSTNKPCGNALKSLDRIL